MEAPQFYRCTDCWIISIKYIQRASVEKLVIKQKRALRAASRYDINIYPIRVLIIQAFVQGKRNETINNTLNSHWRDRVVEKAFSEKIITYDTKIKILAVHTKNPQPPLRVLVMAGYIISRDSSNAR